MPTLPPGTAAVRGAVRSMLQADLDDGVLEPGDLVLVACSGGADSLALAAASAFVAPRLGLRAGAVSVDHRGQTGSDRVALQAVDVCAGLGLQPAFVETPDGGAPDGGAPDGSSGRGPEGDARALRYRALQRARERTGAAAVLLGHTRDDQAETVLLALARGSGTRAIAGMAPRRGLYRRPLLEVSRESTEAACAEAGLTPWRDPTNSATGPWRTATGAALPRAAVRERVLPELSAALGPGVPEALARTAQAARADADLLETLAGAALGRVRAAPGDRDPAGAVVLAASDLATEHPALRTRVLHTAALEAGAPAGSVGAVHVRALEALITHWHGQGPVHLPGGVRGTRRCGNLVLAREPAADPGV